MKAKPKQDGQLDEELVLVRKAKRGDHDAFSRLVRLNQKRIYRLVYRFCRDHDTADELAQETFVKAYMSLDTFREEYRFSSWIGTIATNLAFNHLKRQKRQVSIVDYPIEEIIADPNPGADPSRSLTDREMMDRLEEEVEKLPPEYKTVFILRVNEELSYEEIAKRLGIEMGTVMSRLFRARSRLKKALEDYL
ncbi:MAG: sigma-70 family RNA polymerase sigma factor [candidate division Zixibacteria bacterium]|nr:sigma-70 family RNA polymerase sigma factor [candidate division Zixibacteria bacterium]MBU1470417.1 sigma-70 family RNA polymerase sigma factor [candidate division Zixibacteria bacterium]MBU2625829.1 sigma-70 family RNA polymerase sigma factor [candidate division Zixibacteria bacterium]